MAVIMFNPSVTDGNNPGEEKGLQWKRTYVLDVCSWCGKKKKTTFRHFLHVVTSSTITTGIRNVWEKTQAAQANQSEFSQATCGISAAVAPVCNGKA